MLAIDAVLVFSGMYLAYFLRFDGNIPKRHMANFIGSIGWILPVKMACFYAFGLYRGMWRYTGIQDLIRLVKATLLASAVISLSILATTRFEGWSRGVVAIDWMFTLIFVGGSRLAIRLRYANKQKTWRDAFFRTSSETKNILIIGAGDAGEKLLREIQDNPNLNYRVIGFLDDNPTKFKRSVHGVTVLGPVDSLEDIVAKYGSCEAVIAIPTATGAQMRRIVDVCTHGGISYKTIPGLGEILEGKVSIAALREVKYEDLLGREPVHIEEGRIGDYLRHKKVMVTGAGGSIGSELCRQVLGFHPDELILLDASEPALYNIQMELKHKVGYQRYVTVLGNICCEPLMKNVFQRYRPHVVFHAAAYKHVPMLECNPWQAVENNILGSRIVMKQAVANEVERFVMVSTDKAVWPTNVMGASKRICELIMQSMVGNGTRMMAVRFGNVVGSVGSVIPLFQKQIARGGPVTVTHPEVTRYFMAISEAAQLILQAGAQGEKGEIFLLEMGTPVRIADMARDLIRLSGKDPDTEIEIVYTGLRPGEKLYEELITAGENIIPTTHDKIFALRAKAFNGNETNEDFCRWLDTNLEALFEAARLHDGCTIRSQLKKMIPEYELQESECIL